jgi:mRNA interferase MazF
MQLISRGEIYFANLDSTVGSEQSGYRPVVALQNDLMNPGSPTAVVVPITGVIKDRGNPAHYILQDKSGLYLKSMALCEQIRTIDKRRLGEFLCKLDDEDMRGIERAVSFCLGLEIDEKEA